MSSTLLVFVIIIIVEAVAARKKAKKNGETSVKRSVEKPVIQKESAEISKSLQDLLTQYKEYHPEETESNETPEILAESNDDVYDKEDDTLAEDLEDIEYFEDDTDYAKDSYNKKFDPLLFKVAEFAIKMQGISVLLVNSYFNVDFSRAGRIVDQLEQLGVCGKSKGNSKPRDILIDKAALEALKDKMNETTFDALKDKYEEPRQELYERVKYEDFAGLENILEPAKDFVKSNKEMRITHRDARRGFVLAKILEEPRFKKPWNSRYR